LTTAEAASLRYYAGTYDFWLYFHNIVLLIVYTLAALPLAVLKLARPYVICHYPRSKSPFLPSSGATGMWSVPYSSPLARSRSSLTPLLSRWEIRTGLLLVTWWEAMAQVGVYVVVKDYANYWVHRPLHTP
ncbi:hypothetical protein Taro_029745, partial [Colocasia esculenta]|nr:hypothetical protein [Colocasia esculenta]